MSKSCDREACALHLDRIAASAALLAKAMRSRPWYDDTLRAAQVIHADAEYVLHHVADDKGWQAGDR